MSLSVQLFFSLAVLLLISRLLGEVAVRLRQPALVGELLAGVGLGVIAGQFPELAPQFTRLNQSEVFGIFVELGAFFLMLMAGLELQPGEIFRVSSKSAAVAMAGVAFPFVLGVGLGWLFLPESGQKPAQMIFLGVVLSITDVAVSVRALMDVDRLHSPAGRMIVSAAIFDDVIGLVLLAILLGIMAGDNVLGEAILGGLLFRVGIFFLLTAIIGRYLLPWITRVSSRFQEPEHQFSELLIAALFYGVLADYMRLHFILGAFLAGLFFTQRDTPRETCEAVTCRVSGITAGFLGPIFFASIGLSIDLSAFNSAPVFVLLLLLIAFVGKFAGCGMAAWRTGSSTRDSVAIGTAMCVRGAVALIVSKISVENGLFGTDDVSRDSVAYLYSSIIIVTVVTTVAMPVALKKIMQ